MKMPHKTLSLFDDIKSLGKLWPYLRAEKRILTITVILIPLISLLQAGIPILVKNGIDYGIIKKDFHYLSMIAALYLGAVVVEYLARTGQNYLTTLSVFRMIRNLRDALINHTMKLNCTFHDRSLSGVLATRSTSDFDNLSESLNQGVLTSIVDLSILIGCLIGMFILSPTLAMIALLLFPIVSYIVLKFSEKIKQSMLAARRKIAALNGFAQECLYGSTTIKLLTANKPAQSKFSKLNLEYRDAQMSSVIYDASMFAVIDGISSIAIGLTLWVSVSYFFPQHSITAGILVAFVQYLTTFFEPIKNLGNKIAMLQGAFTSIERIFTLFEEKDLISGERPFTTMKGEVCFNNVFYSYSGKSGDADPILKGISFKLESGNSMAIVGPTGSGKSTIIKLISKLYDGYSGSITIDGQELRELDEDSLRRQIAIVPQDLVIFEGSVAFNISMGDETISMEQIKIAAELVGADKFIDKLPDGYNQVLREQGSNLSYGQRQLIAFARAIVKHPALLILDEATSSIDPESERLIQEATKQIVQGRSVIIIAHRLATIEKCHNILVVKKGIIAESGTHQSLLEAKGEYYKLYAAAKQEQRPAL